MGLKRCAVAITAGLVSLLSFSSTARAEARGGRLVAYVAYETPEACAASVEVTKSDGGHTDGTEKLSLGPSYSYTFSGGGFNPPSGGFDVGARVLYGSPSFEKQTGAKVDVSIPDAACSDFNKAGGDLTFSGSLGRNPDLFRVSVPKDFGTLRALDALGTTYDLRTESLEYGGYTGRWTLTPRGGTGSSGNLSPSSPGSDGSDDDSGACTLSRSRSTSSSGLMLVPAIVLGALVVRRRRSH